MDKKGKLRMLRQLAEKELTSRFLIPLYESKGMGCKSLRYSHRKLEFGKDIVYCRDDEHGNCIYTGVQVKKTKLTTKCIDTIFRQITEAFGEPFTDLRDGKKKDIDKFVVITSNEFLEEAKDSLWASLKGAKLDKLVKCIDGDQLCELLDKHLPSAFWDEYDDLNKYFHAMKAEFEKIKDVSAIGQKEPVPLEKIYVSLRMVKSEKRREELKYREKKEKSLREDFKKEELFDADRAIKDFAKLVIVGPPGSGKTTLLRYLALESCKDNLERKERGAIPIFLNLQELSQSRSRLREFIDDVFERHQFPKAKEYIEEDLKRGKCRIFLDGYDELTTEEIQGIVAERVQDFVKQYPKNQIIATSRIAGYHDELKGFTKLELMEFDDKQMAQFIGNWFGEIKADKAKSMADAIKKNEQIKSLAHNPLMITIIAIIYEEDRKLPEKRLALYNRCVEVLLSKWDIQKRLRNQYPSEKKEFILRKLAFYAHNNNKRILSVGEVIKEIRRYLAQVQLKENDAKPLLDEIWKRSYLIRQISTNSFDFLHLSFQEYFTAMELKEQENGLETIIKHLHEPWWEEAIRLYAGISKDATTLIKRIREELPEDMFHSNLMLFGKFIAEADFTEPSLREEIINGLWSLYYTGEFSPLKEKAIKILGLIKPDEIVDLLIKNLENVASDVRMESADGLRQIGSEKAIGPLIKAVTTDKESSVRRRAAYALREIKSERSIELLIKVLSSTEESSARRRAAYALGETRSEKAIEPLIKVLTTNKETKIRERAADALGGIKSEETIETLVKVLATDKESSIRERAAYALGEIRSEKAVGPLIKALTTDKGSEVRRGAVVALGKIGSKKAVGPLTKILTTHRRRFVRESAAYALGRIGNGKAVQPLIKVLTTHKEPDARIQAIIAIEQINSKKVIGPLIKVLTTDKESYVQGIAAYALGKIGGERVIGPLIKVLSADKEGFVRAEAARALGYTGSEESVEPLIKALTTDKDALVRAEAAEVLGMIGGESAVEPLKSGLKDGGRYLELKVKDVAFTSLERISGRIKKRLTIEAT